jgi:hypothetical protein
MLERLIAADFESLPGNMLGVAFDDRTASLEVKEVKLLSAHPSRDAPFALTLRDAGARTSMPQGTYVYHHPVHGDLPLFTVPVGPDGTGFCYEITFN